MDAVYKGDTAKLVANVFEDDGVTAANATSVTWTVLAPDGTTSTSGALVINPAAPTHTYDYVTSIVGPHRAVAQFMLAGGRLKSVIVDFDVADPLDTRVDDAATETEKTVDLAWAMLEDCFDSEHGGPHLRDATLANFDKEKMTVLAEAALFEINNAQPPQAFELETFPTNARPLLAKGIVLESIRHLMRSYVEQPMVGGAQISYFDRRDYITRWQQIYQLELEQYTHWLKLFKRQQYQLGEGKLLIDIKSGRKLTYLPAMRTRGRFYW